MNRLFKWAYKLFTSKTDMPSNHYAKWTEDDIEKLVGMCLDGCRLDYMADILCRTETSVSNRIRKLKLKGAL